MLAPSATTAVPVMLIRAALTTELGLKAALPLMMNVESLQRHA
jgi:hypothetical protein